MFDAQIGQIVIEIDKMLDNMQRMQPGQNMVGLHNSVPMCSYWEKLELTEFTVKPCPLGRTRFFPIRSIQTQGSLPPSGHANLG